MLDRLFYNGVVKTMNDDMPLAQAVGVKDGRICFVGSDEEAAALSAEERIDLKGKLMLPGFNEGHMHLATYSFTNSNIAMHKFTSVAECLDSVKKRLADKPDSQWIFGRGFNEDLFTDERRYPTKEELDAIRDDIPIMLVRSCGHVAACNTLAVQKIAAFPEAADMGRLIDLETGVVTEAATKVFYKIINEPSVEEVEEMLHFGLEQLVKEGITMCQTDDLRAVPGADWKKVLAAFQNLEKKGNMPARVYEQSQFIRFEEFEKYLKAGYRSNQGGEYFRTGPLKLIEDGSLGARTAALSVPYPGTDKKGILLFTQEELDRFVVTAQKYKMPVAVHCIGDASMDVTIKAIERARKEYPAEDIRHGIVHAQLTRPDILEKMAELDIIAYIQPVFVGSDMDIVAERVSPEWMEHTYAWKTMDNMGILTVGGSDAPVESFSVLENIYFAVTRQKKNGTPEGGWLPKEKLTVEEAVKLFTVNAAKACYQENDTGMIKNGMRADLVVLNENIFEIAPEEIKNVTVSQTVTGGKTVYLA